MLDHLGYKAGRVTYISTFLERTFAREQSRSFQQKDVKFIDGKLTKTIAILSNQTKNETIDIDGILSHLHSLNIYSFINNYL